MRDQNNVVLEGHVGRVSPFSDAQGRMVLQMSVATNDRRKKADGDWAERTEWHRTVFFGKEAERMHSAVQVGDRVHIEGRMQTRKYEKDGQTHYSTEVVAVPGMSHVILKIATPKQSEMSL